MTEKRKWWRWRKCPCPWSRCSLLHELLSGRLPWDAVPVDEAQVSNKIEQKACKCQWPPDQNSFSDCHHFVATMQLIPSVFDTCYVKLVLAELTPAVSHPAWMFFQKKGEMNNFSRNLCKLFLCMENYWKGLGTASQDSACFYNVSTVSNSESLVVRIE